MINNWVEIQDFYNQGNSWSDIVRTFEISKQSILNAALNGKFISRSRSDAMKIYHGAKYYKNTSEKTLLKLFRNEKLYNYLNVLFIAKYEISDDGLGKDYAYFFKMIRVNNNKRKIKDRPELNELLDDVTNLGYRGAGRKYNVCDNTIRNWIKYHNKIKNEYTLLNELLRIKYGAFPEFNSSYSNYM